VQPGNSVEVFTTDLGKVTIQICYDVEFPEVSRLAAARGARLLFVPFCTDERHGYLRVRYCAQARCIENQIYAAIAGTVGNMPFVENMDIQYAQSAILTPSDFPFARDGVAAECTPNVETVVIHDVDLEQLERARKKGTVLNWLDRRHDLYEVVAKDGAG
jgi:predicted amidohydrolase